MCTQSEELPGIISLLGKFESMRSDLPSTKNQINDLDLETIERKVRGICTVRGDIKRICSETKDVGICKPRGPLNLTPDTIRTIARIHFFSVLLVNGKQTRRNRMFQQRESCQEAFDRMPILVRYYEYLHTYTQ